MSEGCLQEVLSGSATWCVVHGDAVSALSAIPSESIDSCVTDPPYALTGGFMGKTWDKFEGWEDSGFAYYLSGLIDGEGHFGIKRHTRGTYAPFFALKLRSDDIAILKRSQEFLGQGEVYDDVDKTAQNKVASWRIQTRDGVCALIDFLDKYSLRAKKRLDFAIWRESVCDWINRPRGNRWHGASDNSRQEYLKQRLEAVRRYTEPPWSGHEFQDWCRIWASEVYRVLKPGAHLLAFGGTRTWHRIACAIEDAGFEIRDSIAWLYASGFPKSLDVSKELDKLAGHWRGRAGDVVSENGSMGGPNYERSDKGEPISAAAAAWSGWGTATKPAFEPVIVARKPLARGLTVAANVLEYGTGALNIDACRIGCSPEDFAELQAGVEAIRQRGGTMDNSWKNSSDLSGANPANPLSRWPANIMLCHADDCKQVGTKIIPPHPQGPDRFQKTSGGSFSDQYGNQVTQSEPEVLAVYDCVPGCPVAELDRQSGNRPGMSGGGSHSPDYAGGMFGAIDAPHLARNDSGGASRFFFVTKASRAERDAGLHHFRELSGGQATDRDDDSAGVNNPRAGAGRTGGARNPHPTVKPEKLIRYLQRLCTPPGGVTLDPFTGSGTAGVAAVQEGFRFVGIEMNDTDTDPSVSVARARIAWVEGREVIPREALRAAEPPKQRSLFEVQS